MLKLFQASPRQWQWAGAPSLETSGLLLAGSTLVALYAAWQCCASWRHNYQDSISVHRLTVQNLARRSITLRRILEIWYLARRQTSVSEQCTTGAFAHTVLNPLTQEKQVSYAEYIADAKGFPLQAAEHHVVHSWRLNFIDVLVALASYACEGSSLKPDKDQVLDIAWLQKHCPEALEMRFFFCPFSVNQHSLQKTRVGDPECEIDKFHEVALTIYQSSKRPLVVILDACQTTLKRSCCLEEIHAAIVNQIPVRYIGAGFVSFNGQVDAENAKAHDAGMERTILKRIRNTGVEKFNTTVENHLKQYAATNLAQLRESLEIDHVWTSKLPEIETKKFLVIGQCGDGKSTLINHFRDPMKTKPARTGMNARGVTKKIEEYPCKPLGNNAIPITMFDTPGVGDRNVSAMELISLLEQQLLGLDSQEDHAPGIHGIIVTNKLTDMRMTLGATIVQTFVERGIIHGRDDEEQWKNVILTGTMRDLGTPDQINCFFHDVEEEWEDEGVIHKDVAASVVSVFYENAPSQTGTAVAVAQDDYSSLEKAMLDIPSMRLCYHPPPAAEMAALLAEKLGITKDRFEYELNAERSKLVQQLQGQAKKKGKVHTAALMAVLEELKTNEALPESFRETLPRTPSSLHQMSSLIHTLDELYNGNIVTWAKSGTRREASKSGLETYCFTMQNALQDEKLKCHFEARDKAKIEKAVQELLDWLDKNKLAKKDELEAKQKELEGIAHPIILKVYQEMLTRQTSGVPSSSAEGQTFWKVRLVETGSTSHHKDYWYDDYKIKVASMISQADPAIHRQPEHEEPCSTSGKI